MAWRHGIARSSNVACCVGFSFPAGTGGTTPPTCSTEPTLMTPRPWSTEVLPALAKQIQADAVARLVTLREHLAYMQSAIGEALQHGRTLCKCRHFRELTAMLSVEGSSMQALTRALAEDWDLVSGPANPDSRVRTARLLSPNLWAAAGPSCLTPNEGGVVERVWCVIQLIQQATLKCRPICSNWFRRWRCARRPKVHRKIFREATAKHQPFAISFDASKARQAGHGITNS